jgi:hypothetical protein
VESPSDAQDRNPASPAVSSKTSAPKHELPTKAEFTFTPEEYWNAWREDREAAPKKFNGKVMDLTGTIVWIGNTAREEGFIFSVILSSPKKPTIGIACLFDMADKEPWATLGLGQKVTLRGLGDQMQLIKARVVEADPSPAINISPAALAKEYAADTDQTLERYAEKSLIVEGQVIAKEADSPKSVQSYIVLKGDSKLKVLCELSNNKEHWNRLKVGDRVKVIGKLDSMVCNQVKDARGELNGPGLIYCYVITETK